MELAWLTHEENEVKTSTLIVFIVFANEQLPSFVIYLNNTLEVTKCFNQRSAEQSPIKTFSLALSTASKVHFLQMNTIMTSLEYWLEAQSISINHASYSDDEDPVRIVFDLILA